MRGVNRACLRHARKNENAQPQQRRSHCAESTCECNQLAPRFPFLLFEHVLFSVSRLWGSGVVLGGKQSRARAAFLPQKILANVAGPVHRALGGTLLSIWEAEW